jgi:hypothetical protein
LIRKSAIAGGDLGARGDESFREEAERVLCNGEEALKLAAEKRGRAGRDRQRFGFPDLWMNYGRDGVMP